MAGETVEQRVETFLSVKDGASAGLDAIANAAAGATAKLNATKSVAMEVSKGHHALHAGAKHGAEGVEHLGLKLGKLHESMEPVREKGMQVKEMLFELAAAVGVATTIKGLFEKFVDSNSEAETASRSLGAAISGLYNMKPKEKLTPLENLKEAIESSTQLVEQFGEASFKLGIPEKAFASMAQTLAPAAASAKKNITELRDMTIDLGRASRLLGKGYEETSHAVMVATRSGMIRPGSFLATLGLSAKELKPLSEAARLTLIMSRVKSIAPPGADILTYADRLEIVKARMEKIAQTAGRPLFEKMVETVQHLNDWLEKNSKQVEETAKLVAEKFVKGVDVAVQVIQSLYKHWDLVKGVVLAIVGIMTVNKAGKWVREFGEGIAEATRSVAHLHAVKLGEDFASSAEKGIGGAADKAGSSFGKLAAAGMLLQAFAIGYTIGTAINGWLEKQSWFKKLMTPAKSMPELAADLAQKRLVDTQADNTKRLVENAKKVAANPNLDYFGSPESYLMHMKNRIAEGYEQFAPGTQRHIGLGDISQALQSLQTVVAAPPPKVPGETAVAPDARAKNLYDFRGSRFDITQNYAEGFDPDRIAAAFSNDLANLGEMRSQSTGFSPATGV